MQNIKNTLSEIPERISNLSELAYNSWWSWHPEARMLFKMIDRASWKLSVHNPIEMLLSIDNTILKNMVKDQKLLRQYDSVIARFHEDMKANTGWFLENITPRDDLSLAFFSAEYGLHHSLPFYAGGLGFLAGDLLKESSDLGIPVVAVGFMYPEGYLQQRINSDGWQQDDNEPIERESAPIIRVSDSKGKRRVIKVPFIEPALFVGFWKVQVGRIELYLMDTDIDENDPWNRGITSHLYIGSPEQRLRQEIVLGIGGAEVLRQMGKKHSVLHLNEGHTVFAILERIREKVATGMNFNEAFEQARSTTIFTTHTPVPAGNDVIPFSLMEKYFSGYWPALGLDRNSFLALGIDPKDPNAGFNMTALGLKGSLYHNAVSKRHGAVARKMWHSLWPELSEQKVPIDSITNGIHVPTWIEPKMQLLFNKYLGSDWISKHDDPDIWKHIDDIPDEELWQTHYWLKTKLMMRILDRARLRWMNEQPDPKIILASGVLLDPNVLTIGFARRFATYKRATLIFQDIERLKNIINDPWKPVQIIFAGKAHPADDQGKRLIQQVFNFAKDTSFGGRIAFVEDYDENLAQYLTHGVDIWLNNPQPPYEACGTSGMKASLNGVPNLSIFDGWWIEGYNNKNGWAFGDKEGNRSDNEDAADIYQLLEKKVIPLFYDSNVDGISVKWIKLMKEPIKSTAAPFSARRMMKEYTKKFYHPAFEFASKPQSIKKTGL
jgi:glycogen phosphorylase